MNFKVKMHNVMVDNHIKKRIYTERSTHLNGYQESQNKRKFPTETSQGASFLTLHMVKTAFQ